MLSATPIGQRTLAYQMTLFLSSMTIDWGEWLVMGLLLLLPGAILLAFFLYLRTAYKQGGWKRVKRDFLIAAIAIGAFMLERIIENHQIDSLLKTIESWFK